jgi:hypothetical protein
VICFVPIADRTWYNVKQTLDAARGNHEAAKKNVVSVRANLDCFREEVKAVEALKK